MTDDPKITGEWVTLGVVGVDSGMLMICDPSYIEGEWKIDQDPPGSDNLREVYRDIHSGQLFQCTALESGVRAPQIIPFLQWDQPLPQYPGLTPNELRQSGRWVDHEMEPPACRGRFSYMGCCDAAGRSDRGGQLMYLLGHPGVGVAFSSGFGDGVYEVKALVRDYGCEATGLVDKRIAKVVIEMIEVDDA